MPDDMPSPETRQDEAGSRTEAGDRRKKLVRNAGVAVGIGSAAIVAALLYAKGSRRSGE